MFRTIHPDEGGWYVDIVMAAEAVTDEDGVVGDTEGTVGPFQDEKDARDTAEHFEEAAHVVSWRIRHEEPAS
jgi:hypothetical protein